MEEHKQYLSDNADEAERRAAEQVMEGLRGLRLEAKVREVAAERANLRRRSRLQRFWVSMVALALVAGAAYLILKEKKTPAAPTPQRQEQNSPPPSQKAEDNKPSEPIAQIRPSERLPNPRYPAPGMTMIRGDADENKALKNLLDQIWYTDYPLKSLNVGSPFSKADESLKQRDFTAAYLELERLEGQMADNDTLRYLKGCCLLEMGEGHEALMYFDPLQGRHAAWEPQVQWYRGLALLLADEREKALALFKKLAAQPNHPYRQQAEKAAGLLSK